MALDHLSTDERESLTQVLTAWRDAGKSNSVIPLYEDVDGDGIPDLVGLDEAGELVLVPGATVDQSVSVSTGEDGAA